MGFSNYGKNCWCFLMGRPKKQEVEMRALFRSDPIDWWALRSHWRSCPAESHKHRNYQKGCSQCFNVTCRRMAELGLDDCGEPLPKSQRPVCGAKTRSGGRCKARVVPGKRRCRLHGGLSTGPKKCARGKRSSLKLLKKKAIPTR
ncbi:HGGxSTG domain-containing protein [Ruegeria arenilitoris]|uniref:HGGxSTG domain-containing protein n=1 Tax=Ruegeria arenilitoris TaxID=1173585 RepID=UPI0028F6D44E|nr:HGGxSTG domain-containing protein [Ruegeria arenilitoris]